MTTNGVLLADHAAALFRAGLHRVTVSLDTLRPDRFRELARFDELPRVLRGIEAAPGRGVPVAQARHGRHPRRQRRRDRAAARSRAREWGAEIRFIEYMDVGGATHWSRERVVPAGRDPADDRRGVRRGRRPSRRPRPRPPSASACPTGRRSASSRRRRRRSARPATAAGSPPTASGTSASTRRGDSICASRSGEGASEADLRALIAGTWRARDDRGAEERLGLRARAPLVPLVELKKDPHLEMHTRGG